MSKSIIIKRVSKNEIHIGKNKIIVSDNSLIYIEAVGEQTAELAEATNNYYEKIFALFPGKVKQLINLNKAGKNSPEARALWKKLNEHNRTEKVAVFGMHPVAKVIASFVMGVTDKKDIRFFSSKEKALVWLNE